MFPLSTRKKREKDAVGTYLCVWTVNKYQEAAKR